MNDNVFAQILGALKIVNDNLIAMNENLNLMHQKIDVIESIMSYTEPNAIGTVKQITVDGDNNNF